MESFKKSTRIIIAVILLKLSIISSNPIRTECNEPSNLSSRYAEMNAGTNITHFFFPPSLATSQQEVSSSITDLVYESQHNYGGTACPATIPRGDFPLMVRSLCPWYIGINHDPLRFPASIPHAISRCNKCVGGNGHQACEYIQQKVAVLRRKGCVSGFYKYEESTELVNVAVVCAVNKEVMTNSLNFGSQADSGNDPISM